MTDTLEHHGVKGQKWGVRRYKELRKEGVSAHKEVDKANLGVYAQGKDANRKMKVMNKAERDKARRTLDAQRNSNFITNTRLSMATKKHEKATKRFNAASEKYTTKAKVANKASYKYQKIVNKAADLPISIVRRDNIAEVKAYLKTIIGMQYRRTGNDRFDESVDSRQITRQVHKNRDK